MFRRLQALLPGAVSGAALVLMSACTTVPAGDAGWQPTVTNTTWELGSLEGRAPGETGGPAQVPHFMLTDDGHIFGFSGCNRFQGQYRVHDGSFRVTRLASTRRACPEDRLEAPFIAALGEATAVSMDHDRLMLLDARDQTLMTLKARTPR